MSPFRTCFFILLALFLNQPAHSDDCPLRIGTNLAGPSDWGAEWPFKNMMKYSRQWITFNSTWVSDGENPWDTQVLDQIPVDEDGYPLELPWSVAGTETTQVVRTVWANTLTLKEGVYVVLYDGEGRIEIDFDGSIISRAPGRIEFEMKTKDNILALLIMESNAGNHIRNIRVLLPGTEATYQENPWTEEWLEKLEPFKVLRFMDWGNTNDSKLRHWDNRPRVEDYTYTIHGIPYEWMAEICNLKQADAWICVPHLADDDFIREMARFFRDNLNPGLKIYVEYSNEIWNWMFDQTHYCFNNGDQETPWPERITPFIQNALDIWSDVFTDQMNRIFRVVGVQGSWQDVSNRIVGTMRPGSFDAFTAAAYFGLSESAYDTLEQRGASATAEDVLFLAGETMRNESYVWLKQQTESIAHRLNIPLIYYEGGQHLTPEPFGTDQPYNQSLMDVQTHPGMYDLYQEWFDSLRTLVPDGQSSLFMNFSFISSKSGKYGSWGILESQFHQDPPYRTSAPKYQAILDNICGPASAVNTKPVFPETICLSQAYPNPFNRSVTIEYRLDREKAVRIRVFNLKGQRMRTLVEEIQPPGTYRLNWDGCNEQGIPCSSGMYICEMTDGEFYLRNRFVLLK